METAKTQYNKLYEKWVPWLEDQYLYYFGKDNKASYVAKDQLGKSKITGNEQVDALQDGAHDAAVSQIGKGGLAQPVGDMVSKEGINRAERGGKDDKGKMAPGPLNTVVDPLAEGGKSVGGKIGGLWGGKK